MSLALQTLEAAFQRQMGFVAQRIALNLPAAQTSFPFRKQQREALEMAISNSPIAAISGIPGSGKTEIARAAIATAIDCQRSTLVVAPYPKSLDNYYDLPLPPLQIVDNQDYRDTAKIWLRKQLAQPRVDFLPPQWLPDPLFERLQVTGDRHRWLNLIQTGDTDQLTKAVTTALPEVFPARQQLLIARLRKARQLLEHRERLHQDYANLSEHALDTMTDAILSTSTMPILCGIDHLDALEERVFDVVVVEDSHHLKDADLKAVAQRARKLVLLGELTDSHTQFATLFQSLLPAYRLELMENHRLHPDLAHQIFPVFCRGGQLPYTPISRTYNPLPEGQHRLIWHDVVVTEQLSSTLWQKIRSLRTNNTGVLTFSKKLCDRLQKEADLVLTKSSIEQLDIRHISDWIGQECGTLWIVCDASDSGQPTRTDIRQALTRATDSVIVLGDKTFYEKGAFSPFFTEKCFHILRDITL